MPLSAIHAFHQSSWIHTQPNVIPSSLLRNRLNSQASNGIGIDARLHYLRLRVMVRNISLSFHSAQPHHAPIAALEIAPFPLAVLLRCL